MTSTSLSRRPSPSSRRAPPCRDDHLLRQPFTPQPCGKTQVYDLQDNADLRYPSRARRDLHAGKNGTESSARPLARAERPYRVLSVGHVSPATPRARGETGVIELPPTDKIRDPSRARRDRWRGLGRARCRARPLARAERPRDRGSTGPPPLGRRSRCALSNIGAMPGRSGLPMGTFHALDSLTH